MSKASLTKTTAVDDADVVRDFDAVQSDTISLTDLTQ